MVRRLCIPLLAGVCLLTAAVPAPKDHFGFVPGDDLKLADYGEIIGYFQKLSQESDRIRLAEFGRSAEGKPMYAAFISSAGNLRDLDRYRDISRKLALGEASAEEARRLAATGKVIVWIDSGLHASETAPAQHSPELAYRMVTGDSEETRKIRENVILMQVPVINPDGLDSIVHWYRKNVGTAYELAPLPWLYQKYAGHDNNRDYFMLNLPETQHVTRLLFQEWFPQIVYNQHQAPAFPARIFVPPYAEPLNPYIPASVMEGINLIGAAMKERFAREEKPGILSYFGYDAWWNGGLRSVPAFHNMHGILTETAMGAGYGTPRTYRATQFPERFGNGLPTKEPSVFYQRPWGGGKWGTREAIDYMLTADFAILELAASRPAHFLIKAWEMARANIEAGNAGKPFAYVVPAGQWDDSSAVEMLRRLQAAGIRVERAEAAFQANGKTYATGSFVLPAGQPFRPYLVDLMEPQKYPEIRAGTTGPTKPPYDIAGWTLPMQMGVTADRVEDRFAAKLVSAASFTAPADSLEHRQTASFKTMAALLDRGERVRWAKDGKILAESQAPAQEFSVATWELAKPRVAVYESWTANIDAGWTEWVLDTFSVAHKALRDADIRRGALRADFDTIILPSQSAVSILHGFREGERPPGRAGATEADDVKNLQRPEYTGGIGVEGLANLERFVREGGTLIALDRATEAPLNFGLAVRALLPFGGESRTEASSTAGYYCPGSILRATIDTSSPLAFGMPKDVFIMSTGGQAFDITLLPDYNKGDRETKAVARYATTGLLASGWISGERAVTGKAALIEARLGKGAVILFGFRPQFRGQTFGTFKLLLNALYLGSAKRL